MTIKKIVNEQERKSIAIELCKQQIETLKWKINHYEKVDEPIDYYNEKYECMESLKSWEVMYNILTAEAPKTIIL